MKRLPSLKPKGLVKILEQNGFRKIRQKGGHLILANNKGKIIVIPMHSKDLFRGMVLDILKKANIDLDTLS